MGVLVPAEVRRQLARPLAAVPGRAGPGPHHGFYWAARVAGLISGFDRYLDGQGELRWKLLGVVPVTQAEGPDVARSAVGRAAGEAMWLPPALLPRFGVEWQATDDRHVMAPLRSGWGCRGPAL